MKEKKSNKIVYIPSNYRIRAKWVRNGSFTRGYLIGYTRIDHSLFERPFELYFANDSSSL